MPKGRTSGVRSHRRGGSRGGRVTRWLAVPVTLVLVGSGVTAGYLWVTQHSCTGSVQATVVTAPRTAGLLRGLAQEWAKTTPSVDGSCVSVQVQEREPAVTAQALGAEWNAADGPAPDVWVPPSSAWARSAAAASEFADQLLPDMTPSVARTPVVIAMPKPLAQQLNWPDTTLAWKDLLDKLAADPAVKLGMSDPSSSTAGLLALSAIIDADDNTDVDNDEIARVFALQKRIAVYKPTSEDLLAEYVSGGGKTLNAFPALEQEILQHNLAHPDLQLVAIYPTNATTEADLPYLMLKNASWSSPQRLAASRAFLDFLRSKTGRDAVQAEGFRDSNRVPGPRLSPDLGLVSQLTALPGSVLLADSIAKTVRTWSALTRPTNVLLVLDVSGSMGGAVPGTGKTKLDLTKAAAAQAVTMFGDTARVGLWIFSSEQQGGSPYKELVKPGPLGDAVGEGTRRAKLTAELRKLAPGGNTGMYDTVWAAYQNVQKNHQSNADNLIVVLTDGADDDQGRGLSVAQLTDKLKKADPAKPVKVVTVALGRQVDSSALDAIAQATGVRTYSSERSYDIEKVLLGAMFGS